MARLMHDDLRLHAVLLIVLINLSVIIPVQSKKASPNIVFMLADDLAYGSAGFGPYGSEYSDMSFTTPTLNKWATEGIIMSNYYSQESCTPSRASLMTGRYPLTIGMQYGSVEATSSWGLNLTETTLADALRKGSYTNYMLGKWNLGHFQPALLPSARGFDYYLGYQSGSSYYWSKKCPNAKKEETTSSKDTDKYKFTDLTYGDGSCYSGYDGKDKHTYSTYLYRDKAINVIERHNYDETPLFLYLAFQAVHDPFEDDDKYSNGIPKSYVGSSMYKDIKKAVVGRKRRQYAMALYLMDSAVSDLHDAVKSAGQLDNTYFIFVSDNGGCYSAGGRNGPLRGNKGTLFEGGTKVDALIYSKLLKSSQRGTTYSGLMHVSDWFPTILDMAGVSFTAKSGYPLDGVSHWSTMSTLGSDDELKSPRSTMLYNYYTDVNEIEFPTGQPVRAVRNSQYKLIEINSGSDYSEWNDVDTASEDDDELDVSGSCVQSNSWKVGTWTQFLFDLSNDPYETTNLYDDSSYDATKTELEGLFDKYYGNRKQDKNVYDENIKSYVVFKNAKDYIVPWDLNAVVSGPTYKKKGCSDSLLSPSEIDDDDWDDTKPTVEPTHKPTMEPTNKPAKSPNKNYATIRLDVYVHITVGHPHSRHRYQYLHVLFVLNTALSSHSRLL